MTLPTTMRAFVLTGHGDMDKLELRTDWPVPVPTANEVLIKVAACGLNNTDVNTRSGWYSKAVTEATTGGAYDTINEEDPTWGGAPVTFPRIQGADACGVVVAVGTAVDNELIGKRVINGGWIRDWNDPTDMDAAGYFGSECDGGFADYTVTDYRNIGVIDSDLSSAELATFSCSSVTAEGMLSRANVGDNDTVLVMGASGGVGTALVQLAKRRGATVIAMASESKHHALAAFGADALLPRNPDNLQSALKKSIGKDCVSVVADVVGGPYFGQSIDVLQRGGRYTCSGAIAGPIVELDLRTFYLRDLTFTGSTVTQPKIFEDVVDYINRGEIQPTLAAQYPLEELKTAQQMFIDKKHTGNIVVTMD